MVPCHVYVIILESFWWALTLLCVSVQHRDPVIALHPSYSFSYAPGVVLEVHPDLWIDVRFYDGAEARVPREEVFKIPVQKFEKDVEYILKCEDQWVGQAVVARREETGVYQLGLFHIFIYKLVLWLYSLFNFLWYLVWHDWIWTLVYHMQEQWRHIWTYMIVYLGKKNWSFNILIWD